jgi:hypothetical protein
MPALRQISSGSQSINFDARRTRLRVAIGVGLEETVPSWLRRRLVEVAA